MKRKMGVAVMGMVLMLGVHLQLRAQEKKPELIVLKAARLFDGKSDGLVQGGMVVVAGSKIVAAGANPPIPDGARVIDLGDATLCPGFIDAHTHLTGEYNDDWNRAFVNRFRREVAEQAIGAAVNARAVVEAGFTTVRDVGSEDFVDIGLRNSIARGLVPGPRMLVAVHTLVLVAGTPIATEYATTCSMMTDLRKGLRMDRQVFAKPCAIRSSTGPTSSSSAPPAECCPCRMKWIRPSSRPMRWPP